MGAKSSPHKNGSSKNGSAARTKPDDVQVITLRIRSKSKVKLLKHCHKLSNERGKQVSFNSAIIEMIGALP